MNHSAAAPSVEATSGVSASDGAGPKASSFATWWRGLW
jgi:hypothetical protein